MERNYCPQCFVSVPFVDGLREDDALMCHSCGTLVLPAAEGRLRLPRPHERARFEANGVAEMLRANRQRHTKFLFQTLHRRKNP